MSVKYLIAASFLISAGAVQAQAGPTATKSPEQITCELTNDCDQVDPSLATRNAEPTRGFSLRRQNSNSSAPDQNANSAASTSSKSGYVRSNQRANSSNRRVTAYHAAPGTGRGHSELTVGFALASATLDTQGLAQANSLLAALKGPKLAGRKVLVAGHTDAIGNREYNLDLSRRRADALVNFLVAHGIDRSLLEARGYGFDRPLPGLDPRAAANRRGEVELAN